MGFIGHVRLPALERRDMGARDFIWLAALGVAARGAVGIDDICRAIDDITAGHWLPVADLVTSAVAEMVRGDHLRITPERDNWLTLSGRGRQTLALLMAQPVAGPSTQMGQVGVRLKLAFLDLIEADERRAHLEALTVLYDEEIGRVMAAERQGPVRGHFGQLWHGNHLDRLRRERALLRAMAETTPPATAARH